MRVKEFCLFIHGPFATKIFVEAGQFGSIDDDFLKQFFQERKVKVREYRKQSMADATRKLKSSVSEQMIQNDNGLRFILPDEFKESSKDAEYIFQNNSIYFYESGTGMLSTQVTVILHKEEEITSLKESEEYARNIVMRKFEIEIPKFIKILSEVITSKKLRQVPGIASDSCKVGHIVWLHTIFYFDKKELFREDTKDVLGELKEDVIRQFSLLLEQVPEDMSPIVDRYVFYGWGRSLIVTKATVNRSEIKRLVELLEIFQYFCFGLYQLDTFLIRKMYELNPLNNQDESVGNLNEQLTRLRSMIQRIENVTSSTIRYLEQFRYSSNVVLISGERPLIQKLEDQWDLDHIEDSIRSKLELLNRDLKSQEQALLGKQQEAFTDEQRYLNQIILVFTVIAVGSLTAQIVDLSPWREGFELNTIFHKTQLWIVLISTGILVGIILIVYSRKAQRIRSSGRSVASKATSAIHRGPKVQPKGSRNPVDGERNEA